MPANSSNFFDTDFTKTMRMPSVDVQAIYATQRKNLEALTEAGKMAFGGSQELAKKQAEIFHKSFEEFSEAGTSATSYASFEDATVKNAKTFKDVYQNALSNIWDLSDLASKSSTRSLGIINKRVAEAFDEVQGYFKPTSTKAAS